MRPSDTGVKSNGKFAGTSTSAEQKARQKALLIRMHNASSQPASPSISPINLSEADRQSSEDRLQDWGTPPRGMAPRDMQHPGDDLATPAVARRLDLTGPYDHPPARPKALTAAPLNSAAPPCGSPPRNSVRNPRSGRRRFIEVSPGTNRTLRQLAPRGRPAPPVAPRDTPPVPRHGRPSTQANPQVMGDEATSVHARGGVRMLLAMHSSDSKCSGKALEGGKEWGGDGKVAQDDDRHSPLVFDAEGLSPASGASRSPATATPAADWHGMPPSSVSGGGGSSHFGTLHSSGYMSTGGFSSMGSTAASHISASSGADVSPENGDTRATPVAARQQYQTGGVCPLGWQGQQDEELSWQSLTMQGTMRLQGKAYGNPGQLSKEPRLGSAWGAPGMSQRPRLEPIDATPAVLQAAVRGGASIHRVPLGLKSSAVPHLPLPVTPNGSPGSHELATAADRTPAAAGSSQETDQELQRIMQLIAAGKDESVKAAVKGGSLVAGVDSGDARGETLLMAACKAGRRDLAKWLVMQAGATINQQDCEGNSAMHSCLTMGGGASPGPMGGRQAVYSGANAISSEGVRLAHWLESMGGNIRLANDFGQTPVGLLMQ